MSLRAQFIKCTLCAILYIAVCSFLLKIKKDFHLTQQPDSIVFISINQTKQTQTCSLASRVATESIDLEIKLLERDEMNGELINLQVSPTSLNIINNIYVALITFL